MEITHEQWLNAQKRFETIQQKALERVNKKAAANPEIDIEAEMDNEFAKAFFEENESSMLRVVKDYAQTLTEHAEGLTLSELKSLTDFLTRKSTENPEAITPTAADIIQNLNELTGTLADLSEKAENEATENKIDHETAQQAAEMLAEMNRKSMAALNERLNVVIKAYQEHTEAILNQYLKDNAEGEEVPAELLAAFIEALMEAENEEEPAAIYAAKHYLEKDQDGNLTPEAIEAAEIFKSAYEKAKNRSISEPKAEQSEPQTARIKEYLEDLSRPALNYIYPNDKTINKLEKLKIDGEQRGLAEADKKKDGTAYKVKSYISFDFDEAAKETDLSEFTLTFTEFDKQVQEAVVSLMKAGNKIITPFMIFKTLTGNSSKQISEKWENDIMKSMKKFNSVNITADLTETAELYPELKQVEALVKQTRLMQFEKTYVKTKNGTEVFAYKMFTEPILYTIADAKHHVGTLDIKLLENSKTSNTVDNTELKIYLLKRINGMKHGQTNCILFETLYNVTQRETTKEKRTTRANAEKLLMQFKADKVINDFEIEMKGRQPTKIKIIL